MRAMSALGRMQKNKGHHNRGPGDGGKRLVFLVQKVQYQVGRAARAGGSYMYVLSCMLIGIVH